MPLSLPSIQNLRLRPKRPQHADLTPKLPSPPSPPAKLEQPQEIAATIPYEILHAIFATAMRPSSSDIDLAEKDRLSANIRAFSHVCGQWRHAAMGHSILWIHAADFSRHSPPALAYYLRLSRPHAIDVGHRAAPWCLAGGRGLIILNNLQEDCHRVRQWNIDVRVDYQLSNLEFFFKNADGTSSYPVHTLRQIGVCMLPDEAWKRLVPTLQKLSLSHSGIHLTPSMDLSNLTELSLRNPDQSRNATYDIVEVIALLRGTPQLQFLRLSEALKPTTQLTPIAANQQVDLPQLRHVSLSESQWQNGYHLLLLISVLQMPSECGLDLSLPPLSEEQVQTYLVAAGNVQQTLHGGPWSPSMLVPRVELTMQKYDRRGFQLTLGTIPSPQVTLDWNGTQGSDGVNDYLDDYFNPPSLPVGERMYPPISISFCNTDALDSLSVARTLAPRAFLRTTSLRLSFDRQSFHSASEDTIHQASDTLFSALINMRGVSTLTLDETTAVMAFPIIHRATFSKSDGSQTPYLPKMQVIAIESTNARMGKIQADLGSRRMDMLTIIARYVYWRGELGLPIRVDWVDGPPSVQAPKSWHPGGCRF
ncbi:hypothetical protein FA13DRAFT_1525065 [Coprinellus micaceus]|uniref:F-box domain-containing protein n=1 Tax=Coprinellus micaceus TaxID=71717 RepID=A0A4Y7SJ97_COPMI|nr:hypothetical protein FA13DRAFT_1525065 [Coprinellus micaceus]